MATNKLLIDEQPLQVCPTLACKIGLNASILLQQIHFWIKLAEKAHDETKFFEGHWWTYGSYADWKKDNFPFWSVQTIRRTIAELEESGVLLRKEVAEPKAKGGCRNWYSIDYSKLDQVTTEPQEGGDTKLESLSIQVGSTFTETLSTDPKKQDQCGSPAEKPKRQRKPNPWIDAISEHIFGQKPGTPSASAVAAQAGRIWSWSLGKDVVIGKNGNSRTIDGCDVPVQLEHFKKFAEDWKQQYKSADVPQGFETFVKHFYPWVKAHQQTVFTARKPDAHCPVCGGAGHVKPAVPYGHPDYNSMMPCPRCMAPAEKDIA